MTRIDGNSLGNLSPNLSHDGAEGGGLKAGTFRGEQVLAKDEASILADAAEEISLHQAEKVENKKHAEREVQAEAYVDTMALEHIEGYLGATKGFDDPAKLARLAKDIRQSVGENPRELARRQTKDPAQQYALLQYAAHDGRTNGGTPAEMDNLQEAIADLEADHGPQIRAALNTYGALGEWAESAQDVADFQQTYNDVVLGDDTISQTLNLVLERLGGEAGEDLGRGIETMIKALGADLSAARPSTDRNRLEALVQDVYQLTVVSTVLEGCKELTQKLKQDHATESLPPFELMKELVAVTGEKWVTGSRLMGLADKAGLQDAGGRIAFLTGVKAALRDMPPIVFTDADSRQSVLNAAQEALDEAIDREEG
jgi:type III secretion protein W